MADDKARKRLAEMRKARVDGMRAQTRRQAALDLLDAEGEVTTATLDARMQTVWVPPDEATLDNLMAQKCQASVAHEERQLRHAQDAQARCADRTQKLRDRVQDAEEAEARAADEVAARQAALDLAIALADAADGDADAAPAGESVQVSPDAANATGG